MCPVRAQGGGSHLHTEEGGLGPLPDHRLPASRAVRKFISVIEATQSVIFFYGGHSKPTHCVPCLNWVKFVSSKHPLHTDWQWCPYPRLKNISEKHE